MTTTLCVLLAVLCVVGSPGHLEALVAAWSADEELKAFRSSLLCRSLTEQWAFLRLLLLLIIVLQVEMKWSSMALYPIHKPHLISVVFLISDCMYL